MACTARARASCGSRGSEVGPAAPSVLRSVYHINAMRVLRASIVVFFLLFCFCAALPRTLARQKRSLTVSCHSHVIISA